MSLEKIRLLVQNSQESMDEAYQIIDEMIVLQNLSAGQLPNKAGASDSAKPVNNNPTHHIVWPGTVDNSGFRFSQSSISELKGVDARLDRCARLALSYSTQDFTVFDGLRTLKEQQRHVANGTSKTMQSKHLDGLAVDLVPWINGKPVWDWDGCYKIALAMDRAATELGIAHLITWGGAWDRKLSDFGNSLELYSREVALYQSRSGKSFVDGPHFEIVGPKQG